MRVLPTPEHLSRKAVAYIRQSSPEQVRNNTGSTAVQRDVVADMERYWNRGDIEVEETDLGVSGSVPGLRAGLNRLIDRMNTSEVGGVGVVDISRLARNLIDYARFAESARANDVLLISGGQIYDMQDPDSFLMSLVHSGFAIRAVRTLAKYGVASRRKKVEEGRSPSAPPVGYETTREGGRWVKYAGKDAERVQRVITLIWDKAMELQSAGAVRRYLASNGLLMPARAGGRSVKWRPATRAAIIRMLKNPAYAGTYVYGKTATDERYSVGDRRRYARQPLDKVITRGANHEPYVSLPRWIEIQAMLSANRRPRSPLGKGDALLQGVLRCSTHNSNFHISYPYRRRDAAGNHVRVGAYQCISNGDDGRTAWSCKVIAAAVLDPIIGAEVLGVLMPSALDALDESLRQAQRQYDDLLRHRQQELSVAAKAVEDAERLFDQYAEGGSEYFAKRMRQKVVDAATYYDALLSQHHSAPVRTPVVLSPGALAELVSLLCDLPRMWHDDMTATDRKRLARAVIRHVRIEPGELVWKIEIEWVNGDLKIVELETPLAIRRRIKELYRAGSNPLDIARILAARGIVRRHGSHAGRPFDIEALRRVVGDIQRGFDRKADSVILASWDPTHSSASIADDLNRRGLRHRYGAWTSLRVWSRIRRLRIKTKDLGPIPWIEHGRRLRSRIIELHHRGLASRDIAREFLQEGLQPPTPSQVSKILAAHGLRSHVVADAERLDRFLKDHMSGRSVREATAEANARGFRTRRGKAWTENVMARKLATLGLRTPTKRGPYKRRGV